MEVQDVLRQCVPGKSLVRINVQDIGHSFVGIYLGHEPIGSHRDFHVTLKIPTTGEVLKHDVWKPGDIEHVMTLPVEPPV